MKNYNILLGLLFIDLTVGLIWMSFANESFFNWAFERHKNQLSWYIRPLFLMPFCYFSYRRNFAAAMGSIFLLFTSMFWFPVPEIVHPKVTEFLAFEKEYLYGEWSTTKLIMVLSIPVSFYLMGLAFWKKSLWMGIGVVAFMAVGKIIWSLVFAGESGASILVPALLGLALCGGVIYYGFKKLEQKNSTKNTKH